MEIFSLIDFHLTNTKTWVRNNTPPLWLEVQPQGSELTHRSRDKMAAISQTTFSTAFSWIKKYEFRYIFHWSVPKSPINNIPALVQIMAWRRPGDKPLSEPMMAHLLTHICVTRPQCVKHPIYCLSMNTNVRTVHVAMTISHLCPGSGHVSLMLEVQHSVLFPRPRKVTSSFYLVFPTLIHVCVSIFPSKWTAPFSQKQAYYNHCIWVVDSFGVQWIKQPATRMLQYHKHRVKYHIQIWNNPWSKVVSQSSRN